MFQPPLHGLIAAAVTPLKADSSVDLDCIGPMTDKLLGSGVSGLYVCGSTGEGMSLSTKERKAVTESYIQAVKGRASVIVQVGHNSIVEACDLARHAEQVGADVLSATCPSYFKISTVDALLDFMSQVSASSPQLPFYYYHIPALTGSQVNIVEFLQRAGERIPNLAGLKYSTTLLHEFQSCRAVHDGRFDIVWGCDEMLLGAIATGTNAAIGSTYNVAAPLYRRIIDATKAGDLEQARELQLKSVKMVEVLAADVFHPALKATMGMLGMSVGPCRLPLGGLNEQQLSNLRSGLEAIGFFEWCGFSQ